VPENQHTRLAANSAANSLLTSPKAARNSAAGRLGEIITKLLADNAFVTSKGYISDGETYFFPAVREMGSVARS
jgi:hypothetical protein